MSYFTIPISVENSIKRDKLRLEAQLNHKRLQFDAQINAERERAVCRPLVLEEFKKQYMAMTATSTLLTKTFTVDIDTTCRNFNESVHTLFPPGSIATIEGNNYKITSSFVEGSGYSGDSVDDDQSNIVFKKN
jgi:hypothetical protein